MIILEIVSTIADENYSVSLPEISPFDKRE